MPKQQCYNCSKWVSKLYPIKASVFEDKENVENLVQGDKSVCEHCRLNAYKTFPSTLQSKDMSEPGNAEHAIGHKRIKLDLPRLSSSMHKCTLCGFDFDSQKQSRKCLSLKNRTHIFIETGVLVTTNAKSCTKHFENDILKDEILENLTSQFEDTYVSSEELKELLVELRMVAKRKGCLNFDSPGNLSNQDYIRLTGITKAQFDIVLSYIQTVNQSCVRSVRTALGILLVKLRTALPSSILSTLFGIGKQVINKTITSVRVDLCHTFVPHFLGFGHISRQEIIDKHTTVFAKNLFAGDQDDVAITVADGTYIYIEKSSNYSFQRRSFSMHKGQHLVKPMLVVASDGYIISSLGPYLADGKNNDANITKHAFARNTENIKEWFNEDDIMIVDRGFRDCLDFLQTLGINTEMPHFLPKGQRQHSTQEGNESRYVTKVRWVVESANARIKKWKALGNRVPNVQVPNIRDFVNIVCALCNAFRPPLASNSPQDEIMAERMLALCSAENTLQQKVKQEGLDKKRVIWREMDDSILEDFPKLSENELRDMTFGVYQIKQAEAYVSEHLSDTGDYKLLVHKEQKGLIKVQIQSRHTSSKVHNLWIEYILGIMPIFHWYCTCKAGARVVGCCAHIASVLWYLGYYRHRPVKLKSSTDFFNYVEDAVQIDNWTDSESENNDD